MLHYSKRFLLVTVLCLIGCTESAESTATIDESAEPETNPWADVNVIVDLTAHPKLVELWQPDIDEWSARTGATAELLSEIPDGTTPTLRIMDSTQTWDLYFEGTLQTLPMAALEDEGLWDETLDGLRRQACQIGGLPLFVPLSSPVLVCYYRADLLRAARLKPPTTWDEYAQLVRERRQWAGDLEIAEPWNQESRAATFLARAISYARYPGNFSCFFDVATCEPLINSAGFIKALEETQALLNDHPKCKSFSIGDCSLQLRSGQAAIGLAYETPDSPQQDRPDNNSEVQLGFCAVPGRRLVYDRSISEWKKTPDETVNRPTLTGFTGIGAAVSANSTEAQVNAACNLLANLTSEDIVTSRLPGKLKSICRQTQTGLSEFWYQSTIPGAAAVEYGETVTHVLGQRDVVAMLPVVGRQKFVDALNAGLTAALENDVSATDALNKVAADWVKIRDEIGRARVLNSYRTALGLTGI